MRSRLLLHPDAQSPLSFADDDDDDEQLWQIMPAGTHCCHALYLGAETTSTDKATVPWSSPWPIA